MAEEKIIMTREGYEKLEEEYRHLIDVEKPDVIEQIQAARAQGDLSENADYSAARDRQSKIEARISEIEHIKDIVEIVDTAEKRSGKNNELIVGIGAEVVYKNLSTKEIVTVRMVGSLEVDPTSEIKSISDESAIGKALKGKKVGDVVLVETSKPFEAEITSVEYIS